MATVTQLVDDITGETGEVETVRFSLNDEYFSIDLGPKNRDALQSALGSFIESATSVSGPGARKPQISRPDLAEIRRWAATQGYEVAPIGRVAQSIIDAYDYSMKEVAENHRKAAALAAETAQAAQAKPTARRRRGH